jgi:NAD(P)-dependent dehydrogenase (short-subunit alcohol dehydrogenase family)
VPETPKVALVAGGPAGVGQAFCAALHATGYRVYGTSRKPTDAAWPMLAMELRDPASVQACVAEVLRREGRIDVLVTGAGRYIAGAV